MEASLAFQGIDFRDLWRAGSGLTLRRLEVLLRALPFDAPLWVALQREREAEAKPTVEKLRERQAYYNQRAKEAG